MKPYNAFSDRLKEHFGCRVHRISVDAGFTCPNRDGTVGSSGCIFCGGDGSGSFGIARGRTIRDQLEHGKEVMVRKYKAGKFLAYFQAYSNTYASPDYLRLLYDEALAVVDVAGLIVGTRPDCVDDAILDLLAEYHRKTYFWLELGLQSPHDRTLAAIERGHTYATFADAVSRAKERGLRVCAHVILYLPGETRDEMLVTPEILNLLGVDGVKLHLLHVMKGTKLEELYAEGKVCLPDRDEYVGMVCDFLERLDERIIVQRLTGDGGKDLVAPQWSKAKFEVLNAIDGEMGRRGTRQGEKQVR